MNEKTTHFGFETIPSIDKVNRVGKVFSSVAQNYDLMNDFMSFGLHRCWKTIAISHLALRPDHQVLDLAGGTGDLTMKILSKLSAAGHVTLSDINADMLQVGKDRLLDHGFYKQLDIVEANAEQLPFDNNQFHRVIMGFGLRNVTDKPKALQEIYRVLKPGGQLIVLEFSKTTLPILSQFYDQFSFKIIPKIGKWVAKDEASYQYLVESIRRHPDQAALKSMMLSSGFDEVCYSNLSGGIVAIHKGVKY